MSQRPFSFSIVSRGPFWLGLLFLLLGMEVGYGQSCPSPLLICTNVASSSCNNPNGAIQVVPGAALPYPPPYSYSVQASSGPLYSQPTPDFSGLPAGIYTVNIYDAIYDVIATTTATVGDLAPPALTLTATPALCDQNNGTISIMSSGGSPPITYALGSGAFSSNTTLTGIPAGPATVNALDGNGCSVSATTTVPLTNNLTLTMPADITICQGTKTTLVPTTNATGFAWTPASGLDNASAANPVASPDVSTTYALTATLGVCSAPGTLTVNVLPAPVAQAESPFTICYGKSVQLEGSGGASYSWSPTTYLDDPTSASPISEMPASSITYRLTVHDANNCASLTPAVVQVNVIPPLKVLAGPDTSVVAGQSVMLYALDVDNVGFTGYTWTPATGLDNPAIANPTAVVTQEITYIVTATQPDGCAGTDTVTIKAFTLADIYVPNAFTPNHDGHNDVLHAIGVGIKDFQYFTVYNRWGQQVFTTKNPGAGWDGTLGGRTLVPDTYVWMAAGIDYTGHLVQRKGVVLLIR